MRPPPSPVRHKHNRQTAQEYTTETRPQGLTAGEAEGEGRAMSRWLGTVYPVLAVVALFVCPVGGAGDTCAAPAGEAGVITAAVASLIGLPKTAGVCPRTCRTCGCDDDSTAAAAIHASVVSCEAAFAANDFSCSGNGPFFNTAAAGSPFNATMVEVFTAACRKSCRACHHPHSCRDYSGTCRASVAADRAGTCSRTLGPRFGAAAAAAARDDIVACAAACGACEAAPGAPDFCLDHDAEFASLVPHFASCAAARAAYGGRCDDVAARHAGDPAAFANVSVAAPLVELYLRSMCAHECGFCAKAPTTIYAVTTEASVMPGGEYHLQDKYVTCEDTAVWALETTTPVRFYVYSLDGRWTVGKDVAGRSLLDLGMFMDYCCELQRNLLSPPSPPPPQLPSTPTQRKRLSETPLCVRSSSPLSVSSRRTTAPGPPRSGLWIPWWARSRPACPAASG